MTILEKIEELMCCEIDFGKDSSEKLVAMAYYIGLEKGVKEGLDKHNALARKQWERARKCRFHRMAGKIIGNTFIYSPHYAQDMTSTFGNDITEIEWK